MCVYMCMCVCASVLNEPYYWCLEDSLKKNIVQIPFV